MATIERYERKVTLYVQTPDGFNHTRQTDRKYKYASASQIDGVWGIISWHEQLKSAQSKINQSRRFESVEAVKILDVAETEPNQTPTGLKAQIAYKKAYIARIEAATAGKISPNAQSAINALSREITRHEIKLQTLGIIEAEAATEPAPAPVPALVESVAAVKPLEVANMPARAIKTAKYTDGYSRIIIFADGVAVRNLVYKLIIARKYVSNLTRLQGYTLIEDGAKIVSPVSTY